MTKEINEKSESLKSLLANNIIMARKAIMLTQEELAERAGISRTTLAKIEVGDIDPLLSTIDRIADALKISPSFILMSKDDLRAILNLLENSEEIKRVKKLIKEDDLKKILFLLQSDLRKNQSKAAKGISNLLMSSGLGVTGAVTMGAIGAAAIPMTGMIISALLGKEINYQKERR